MAKHGCGAQMAFLIVLVILVGIGGNEAVGYYLSHCSDEGGVYGDVFDCLMDDLEDEAEEGEVVATGTYTYKGYDVTVTANIPLGGGAVTGSVSGTCSGRVTGNYNGQPNGAFTGTLAGECSPFVLSVPASATFTGTVNKTDKTAPINFVGKGGGITHEGSMVLSYP